jgi:hypothetical protein
VLTVVVSSHRWDRRTLRSAGFEERHALLQLTDLLRLLLFVHALALQATGTRALARTIALGLGWLATRPKDKVIELREDRRWQLVNLQLDFLGALR